MNIENKASISLPSNLLHDKVAIITGGSRGIGKATVLRFAEAGAHVVINYLSKEDEAIALANEIREKFGREAIAIQADVSKIEQANDLIEATLDKLGRIDVLVANAGLWQGEAIENMSEELWDKTIDVNLKGTWAVCRAAVPSLRKQGGSIVIVSSTAGQRGEAFYSNYAASKGGQISFTKALATELAPDIRVNSVAPGWVDTEMSEDAFKDPTGLKKILDAIPLHRLASADDIALSIAFLSSDLSRHITGEVLNINGGSVLCG